MDTDAFVRWALDDARTIDQRFVVELLVERFMGWWRARNNQHERFDLSAKMELDRQRNLNPAYEPHYSEKSLRRIAEVLPEIKDVSLENHGWRSRQVRDISVVRFFPWIEKLTVNGEVEDCSVIAELPCLRVLLFGNPVCEDYRPLARCTALRELGLSLGHQWPEIAGIESLRELESLSLQGNLLVFPHGVVFPNVRRGTLNCSPLQARNVRDLPQLPACEFLHLTGVHRLDGIEAMPRLRNLTLTGPVRDFTPLTALTELTWLQYNGDTPLDVAPLTRLPKLHYLALTSQHIYNLHTAPPRDLSPLVESVSLRELHIAGCPPLDLEAAALNATFPPCDDLFLAEKPRRIPPLRMIVGPQRQHPQRHGPHREPGDPELVDVGLRQCEAWWVKRFVERLVAERVGHTDWGEVTGYGEYRTFTATVHCYEAVEHLPEIVEAVREAIARLRGDYLVSIHIFLRVLAPEPTEAQAELLEQFQKEQDDAHFEQVKRDHKELLEKQHRLQLKKEAGESIDPKQFAPSSPEPALPAPWERETDEDEDDDEAGGIAVKKKPDPPPMGWDDDHPLADNYRLMATLTLGEIWFHHGHRHLAVHLMAREPDVDIPEEKKEGG